MTGTSRFECASSALGLSALVHRTRRVFWVCLGVGVALHLSLTRLGGLEAEQQTAKPLTTQFVKRQPRLTKPLELKKRPQPKRRQARREMVAVTARVQRDRGGARFQPVQALRGLARPSVAIGRIGQSLGVDLEPESVAQAVEGGREVEEKIDMSLELMDIEALDTGRYHAMVVQEAGDRMSIKGFCKLSVIFSPQFFWLSRDIYGYEMMVDIGFHRVASAMNELTDIKTECLGRMTLMDKELLRAPWVLFAPTRTFELSAAQRRGLGEYMMAGGFIFGDQLNQPRLVAGWAAAFRCIRIALTESLADLGVIASIQKLPNSHPLYHCYFDFDGPPIGSDYVHHHQHPDQVQMAGFTEGIEVEGRMLAFIGGKGYPQAWSVFGPSPGRAPEFDPTLPLRFAVNSVVFALTQEGSITRRLMESVQ